MEQQSSFGTEQRREIFEGNRETIGKAWDSIDKKIRVEKDFDEQYVANVEIRLKDESKQMVLVFQRIAAISEKAYYVFDLGLCDPGTNYQTEAKSGQLILWTFGGDHHRISITEGRTLESYDGCGLGSTLLRLADKIIATKIIPITILDPRFRGLPYIGTMEDTAVDKSGRLTRWTTFQAQHMGFVSEGISGGGSPVFSKRYR